MYTPLTFQQLYPFVKANIISNITPFLLGKPGIGKSQFARQLAKEFDTKVFSIQINQLADRSDLTGQRQSRTTDKDGNEKWELNFFPHAKVQEAITYAKENPDKPVILFLDEINRTSSDVTSSALSFITERTIGTEQFPDNIRFIAAGNDDGNVVALDDASITRFMIYKVKPDAQTLLTVLPDLNPYIKDVITKYPELIQNNGYFDNKQNDSEEEFNLDLILGEESAAFNQSTAPRTIDYLSQTLNALGYDKSLSTDEMAIFTQHLVEENNKTLLQIAVEGQVGFTDFTGELLKHMFTIYHSTINQQSQAQIQDNEIDPAIIRQIKNAKQASAIETITEKMTTTEMYELLFKLPLVTNTVAINDFKKIELTMQSIITSNKQAKTMVVIATIKNLQQYSSIYSKRSLEILIDQISANMSLDSSNSLMGLVPIINDIIN